jgi:phosphatidylglycerophosphate synthase
VHICEREPAIVSGNPTNVHAVIIGREITISALREWAATLGSAARGVVAVNAMGKWKTAAQVRRMV